MNGATNHVAENAYLWECTIVVTRFFKVVLAIFNAARDTKVKSAIILQNYFKIIVLINN